MASGLVPAYPDRPGRFIALAMPATVVLVLAFLAIAGPRLRVDSSDYRSFYRPVAMGILDGRGLVDNGDHPATRYPPGFPLILALGFLSAELLGVSEGAATVTLNAIGYSIVCVLAYLLATRLWGPRPAIITWVVTAIYPLGLVLTTYPSPEIPFTAFLIGALLALVRGVRAPDHAVRPMLLCGVLVGAAMLVRPIGVGVGILLAGSTWWLLRSTAPRRRLLLAGAVLAGNLAIVLPWEAWVLAKTGQVIPLSTGGAPSMRDGLTFGIPMRGKGFRHGISVPRDVAEVMAAVEVRYEDLRTPGDIARLMAEQMRLHPIGVGKLAMIKAARCWYGTDSQRMETPILALQLLYLTMCLLALRRAWMRGGEAKMVGTVVAAVVAGFWAMAALALPLARYSVPSMVLLFTLLPALRRAETWHAPPAEDSRAAAASQ